MSTISVVKLVSEWHFTLTKDGGVGTRKYIDASSLPTMTPEFLPDIGDSWSTEFNACRCVSIDISYLNDNDNCPKTYLLQYDSSINDDQQWEVNIGSSIDQDEEDLPMSIETSSEMIAWDSEDMVEPYAWRWFGGINGGESLEQPVNRIVNTATIRLGRTIRNNFIDQFLANSFFCEGKLNDDVFLGFPKGTIIYSGMNANEKKTETGNKTNRNWEVVLMFTYRSVYPKDNVKGPDDETDGWNWVMDEKTGLFNVPYHAAVNPQSIYGFADFKAKLIKSCRGQNINIANIAAVNT